MGIRDLQRIKLIQDGRKAIAMFNAGVTHPEICAALNRSRMTVYRAIKAARAADRITAAPLADPLLDGLETVTQDMDLMLDALLS